MEERERRIGLNEAIFREANERIREVNETFATLTDELIGLRVRSRHVRRANFVEAGRL